MNTWLDNLLTRLSIEQYGNEASQYKVARWLGTGLGILALMIIVSILLLGQGAPSPELPNRSFPFLLGIGVILMGLFGMVAIVEGD